jgi:hypothetical protein
MKIMHEMFKGSEEKLDGRLRKLEAEIVVVREHNAVLSDLIYKQDQRFDQFDNKIKEYELKIEQQRAILEEKLVENKRNM